MHKADVVEEIWICTLMYDDVSLIPMMHLRGAWRHTHDIRMHRILAALSCGTKSTCSKSLRMQTFCVQILSFNHASICKCQVWMATAHVYLGLFNNNKSEVKAATQRIFAQLYSTAALAAGLKEDGSFFQHDHGQTCNGSLVGPFGQLYVSFLFSLNRN